MKPVVLLLSGMLNDARIWSAVRPALAAGAEVRVVDPEGAQSIAAVAETAWSAVADVPPERPLFITGFSMGGYVAIEMLATLRRPVHGAVLIATSARPESAEGLDNRRKTIAAFRADFDKAVERIIRWGTEDASSALVEQLRDMMRAVGPETAIRQVEAIMTRHDHRAALARLALPVRVLCGASDRLTPVAMSEEIARLIPGATLQCIPAAGHMLPVERPSAVIDNINELLNT